jgi:hypothetical protein
VPENRPLADFLSTLAIKAKVFATELTSHNVVDKDLHGNEKISREHIDNNLAIRKMLKERGVKPCIIVLLPNQANGHVLLSPFHSSGSSSKPFFNSFFNFIVHLRTVPVYDIDRLKLLYFFNSIIP